MRRRAKRLRDSGLRAVGIERYTWAALFDLDRKLVDLFHGKRDGVFIELGGNDGLQQSNTLALSRLYGWKGLLVEADPELAAECRTNRRESVVICAGAGATWGAAELDRLDLTGSITQTADPEATDSPALPTSAAADRVVIITAPLSDLIDAAGIGSDIDLLSLDVEGYELPVLAGLDLERHAPTHILVETSQLEAVTEALAPHYTWIAQWSYHDHLFSRTSDIS